jgi:hypothetical protein
VTCSTTGVGVAVARTGTVPVPGLVRVPGVETTARVAPRAGATMLREPLLDPVPIASRPVPVPVRRPGVLAPARAIETRVHRGVVQPVQARVGVPLQASDLRPVVPDAHGLHVLCLGRRTGTRCWRHCPKSSARSRISSSLVA